MIKAVKETLDKTWIFGYDGIYQQNDSFFRIEFTKQDKETTMEFGNRVIGMVARMNTRYKVSETHFYFEDGLAEVIFF